MQFKSNYFLDFCTCYNFFTICSKTYIHPFISDLQVFLSSSYLYFFMPNPVFDFGTWRFPNGYQSMCNVFVFCS